MAVNAIEIPTTAAGELLTADGRPLKESLQRSLRRRKLTALALVAPAVVFLFVLFAMPVIYLMTWSVDDTQINKRPSPAPSRSTSSGTARSCPSEPHYEAMFKDIADATGLQIGRGSTRMNYAKSKWKSLMKKTKRKIKALLGKDPDFAGPYKETLFEIDKRWGDISFWHSLGIMQDPYTAGYYLNSFDLKYGFDKEVVQQARKPPHLQHALAAHPADQRNSHRGVSGPWLPGGAPARDPAATLLESADDLRADAFLDIAAGADRGVDDHAAAGGGGERHPRCASCGR